MLDYLDDIASDFSVLHRIRDITTLDGPMFFRLAWRLPAYTGAMQARVLAVREADEQRAPRAAPAPTAAPSRALQQQDINPGTQAALLGEPAFRGIFSFGKGGG